MSQLNCDEDVEFTIQDFDDALDEFQYDLNVGSSLGKKESDFTAMENALNIMKRTKQRLSEQCPGYHKFTKEVERAQHIFNSVQEKMGKARELQQITQEPGGSYRKISKQNPHLDVGRRSKTKGSIYSRIIRH